MGVGVCAGCDCCVGALIAREGGKSSVIDKHESRRIRVEIRRVLLQVWDPIGIKDQPSAQDEYDSYLGGIFELMVSGASDERIAEHLCRIVTEQMGLAATHQGMRNTVTALRQIHLQNSK